MNSRDVQIRLDKIMTVYRWTLKHNRGLNNGQRICITMERVALIRCQQRQWQNPFLQVTPQYSLPPLLNEKVNHIYKVILNNKINE